MELIDSYGRIARKLRVSVTDRCDLRCTYCMPAEGLKWLPQPSIMSFEDIERLARIAVSLGVEKIRLTGGEPLVRKGLDLLVAKLAAIPGLRDLSLTSNGIRLTELGPALAKAGLRGVNVSLDSLDRERFHELTRRDALDKVLAGIAAATELWPGRVKVNCVATPGLEAELMAFAELARERDVTVRFIEFMPLDADEGWSRGAVLPGAALLARLRQGGAELEAAPSSGPSSPAREYRFRDGRGALGFINSVSEPFCASCDRIRVTADGRLRTCLFSVAETDILGALRGGSEAEVAAILRGAVARKEAGHRINEPDFERASRSMSQIGG